MSASHLKRTAKKLSAKHHHTSMIKKSAFSVLKNLVILCGVLSYTQPVVTIPLIRFAEQSQMEGSPSWQPKKEVTPCDHPLWTGSQNNSNHIWQRRVRGESTHIWQGAQTSLHLRCTLKGDRRQAPCQDELAVGEIPGRSRQKTACTAL